VLEIHYFCARLRQKFSFEQENLTTIKAKNIRKRFEKEVQNNTKHQQSIQAMENLTPMQQALMLMIVGMGTVFVILILIINLSKAMIALINRFAPEEAPKKAPAVATQAAPAVNPSVAEAIRKAVAQIAPGAKVVDIRKR
jgi:oxaloacetate decarboxylase gamma subunit